jgi:hypothetical protein
VAVKRIGAAAGRIAHICNYIVCWIAVAEPVGHQQIHKILLRNALCISRAVAGPARFQFIGKPGIIPNIEFNLAGLCIPAYQQVDKKVILFSTAMHFLHLNARVTDFYILKAPILSPCKHQLQLGFSCRSTNGWDKPLPSLCKTEKKKIAKKSLM